MIQLTEKAIKKVKEFQGNLEKSKYKEHFRIQVTVGGCSGYMYNFIFDDKTENDIEFEQDGVKIVTELRSMPLINDSVIDYEETLTLSQFVVRNPNSGGDCGCGMSFSV